MKKSIKITYDVDDTLFDGISLRLKDFLHFVSQLSDADDLEIEFSRYGDDSVLMTVTSYEDDIYNSWLIFNNDVN